jgi:hypothetical protein
MKLVPIVAFTLATLVPGAWTVASAKPNQTPPAHVINKDKKAHSEHAHAKQKPAPKAAHSGSGKSSKGEKGKGKKSSHKAPKGGKTTPKHNK